MLGDDLERVEEHPNEEPQHARAPALAFGRQERRQHEGRVQLRVVNGMRERVGRCVRRRVGPQ